MFITTQGEYALRCMIALASAGNRTLSLKQIAEAEGLSKDYVGKLLNRLKKAGLVQPIHGSKGGYRLSRPAAQIRVSDVYLASEGDGFKFFCINEGFTEADCRHLGHCGLRQVWKRVYDAAFNVMDGVTLDTLIPTLSRIADKFEETPHETAHLPG